eukprot:GHUV01025031.1.p1 GENE.GHUV01025031.1~~GHUV01025031.1.p1  ORF type:complete len:331 (+),score=83.90 GHUV01025031.1:127-1119(+)
MRSLLLCTSQRRACFGRAFQATQQQQQLAVKAAAMQPLTGHIPGFLDRIAEVNNGLSELTERKLVPFGVDGQQLGFLKQDFVQKLLSHQAVFQLTQSPNPNQHQALTLNPSHTTMEQRTAAVAGVLDVLRTQGMFKGWRNELYPVTSAFDKTPMLLLERAAAPYFGIRAYGIHINGYVEKLDGSKLLWVARRSKDKPTWPGMLDHIVAGGQPYGLSCADNVVKECWEEAGIPQELASAAVPVGFISYVSMTQEGLKPDVLFCYDLKLTEDFVPKPQDGEVRHLCRPYMVWEWCEQQLAVNALDVGPASGRTHPIGTLPHAPRRQHACVHS